MGVVARRLYVARAACFPIEDRWDCSLGHHVERARDLSASVNVRVVPRVTLDEPPRFAGVHVPRIGYLGLMSARERGEPLAPSEPPAFPPEEHQQHAWQGDAGRFAEKMDREPQCRPGEVAAPFSCLEVNKRPNSEQ